MTKAKVSKIIKETRKQAYKLRCDDIEYILELANEHPRWSVSRIFQEALRPRMRTVLSLGLTPKLLSALKKASNSYQITMSDVAYHALKEWLKNRNFLTTA